MSIFGLHLPKKVDNVFGSIGSGVAHAAGAGENLLVHNNPVINAVNNDVIHPIGSALQRGANAIPNFSSTSPARFLNNAVINPIKTTDIHVAQALQGQNPYHGSVGQQLGQAGQDVINAASVLPVGRGAELVAKGGSLLPRVVEGAKTGAKFGAGFGAAQGASTALQQQQNVPQALRTIGTNTAIGGVGGGLVGGVLPVAGASGRVIVRTADNRTPLNEAGFAKVPSPAPGLEPTSTPVTSSQRTIKVGQATPPDFLQTSPDYVPKTPQELADLSPKEQMALTQPNTPLAPAEVNTATNPYKSITTPVQPGDYAHAVVNSQVVSRPIDTARTLLTDTLKQLKKQSPGEYNNFWQAVEDPSNSNHSPLLQNAIDQWRNVDNKVHGESQALGGNTNYLTEHALHPWQLPEEFTNHIVNGGSPKDFKGLNNLSRKYRTITEGQVAGLKLGTDPLGEANRYLQANSSILRKASLKQGLAMADAHQEVKPVTLDLGNGHTVQLSKQGASQARGVQYHVPSSNPVIKGVRTAGQGIKTTILSGGQFHTINIGLLRSVPALIGSGHPRAAATAAYDALRGSFSKRYADEVIGKAIKDGTVDKAAQIGMPFGSSGYNTEGTFLKSGVGHQLVFNQQIPMFYNQVVRSIIADLEKKGIPLNSAEAQAAGKAGNNTLGFINKEVQKIPPNVNQGLSDLLLARQFTHSKFSQLRTAATPASYKNGAVAGKYAAANIGGNVITAAGLITGVGYALSQKSDNIKDSLLRALIDPAVATPGKDSKGNTIKYRLPGTDTSDIAKLLGIKLVRNSNGHLGVSFNPQNVPPGVADYARARLAPFPSAAVKVATNTTYASKPLYDPNAQAGVKAEQGATSVLSGFLPIGAQGLPLTKAVKDRLPGNIQNVLNAQTPGSNPLLKSVGSSFGLTPTTDQTVGKGLQSSQYFSALGDAKSGLNSHEQAALELYAGNKKNPVTGKYDVQPNVNDTVSKARTLLDQPKVIDHLISMNQKLQSEGQKTDPLWSGSKDQITKVLQYQAMPPGGPDRTHWLNQNKDWYQPLSNQRTAFFNSLPTGDANKPSAPIEYPNASPEVASQQEQFFNITDSKQRADFLQDHPEVQTQLDAQVDYNNKLRQAQGYSTLDTYPTASPGVQKIIDTYSSIPKGGGKKGGNLYRSQWIQSHPQDYAAMQKYFTQSSLYGLEKDAGQAQFQDTGFSSKGLGDIYNLGQYDIGKQTDANGNAIYALGSTSGSSGSGSYAKTINPNTYAKRISVKGAPKLARAVSVKKIAARPRGSGTGKIKVSTKKAAA